MVACVSMDQQRSSIQRDIAAIYSDYDEEIREFFVEEAVRAGVKTIRPMQPSEILPVTNPNEIPGCAYALKDQKLILIEIEKPLCVKLDHLAHEIAHIGSNCSGHNNVFYKYNYAIAQRYEQRFPNAGTRRWFAPVQSVANVEAIYQSPNC